MSRSRLAELSALGQSVWIDTLSREIVRGGVLESWIADDSVVGVTSNPSIFQKALSQGDAYDAQLRELVAGGESDPSALFLALARDDIQEACDLLAPVYERTGRKDGYVSMEVLPALAYDTQATFDQMTWIHETFDRPNLLVKIPATLPGLPAIEDAIASGRSINITLIFSLERYTAVVEAYLRGLERLVAAGGDPSKVASVASFFVSRVDTEADRRLEEAGRGDLCGKLAVANAKLAYQHYLEQFGGERWEYLAAKGATVQRPLWASTSTKNPAYRDVLYVEELVGPDTVNTMPAETLEAYRDHGVSRVSLTEDVDGARRVFADVAAAGVDYDDVVLTLETEGVDKFAEAFDSLLAGIEARRGELAAA